VPRIQQIVSAPPTLDSVQGSGKTLAFALPIINFLVKEALNRADESSCNGGENGPRTALRALILCPTRELALQVAKDVASVTNALCVRVIALVGGISPQKQARLLSYKPPIVVATPGRLWDLMQSGAEHLVDLRFLNFLVLDEADRMVAQGHYEELTHILAHIPKSWRCVHSSADQNLQSHQDVNEGIVTSVGGAAGDEMKTSQQVLVGALRTYVFSATLALPEQLKSKLQHGGAGSRGSRAGASLECLMQRLTFRGKPKVCSLSTAMRSVQIPDAKNNGDISWCKFLMHVLKNGDMAWSLEIAAT
jgi:superfamily II DNA/RNA helicase